MKSRWKYQLKRKKPGNPALNNIKLPLLKTEKIYKRTQFPITLEDAWEFPVLRIEKITPQKMGFRILYKSGGDKMYPGQLIRYRVNVLPQHACIG
jgi:hypothetical protein